MRKKLSFVLFPALFVLVSLFIPCDKAYASKGTIKDINYDLILAKGATIEYPLSVKIGDMTFDGSVKQDSKAVDDNLDEYILECINKYNMDIVMLKNSEDVIDMYTKELKKLDENYSIDLLKILGSNGGWSEFADGLGYYQKYVELKDLEESYALDGGSYFSAEHFMYLYMETKGKEQFDAYSYGKDVAKSIHEELSKVSGKVGEYAKKSSSYLKFAFFIADLSKWTSDYNDKFEKFYAKYSHIQQCYDYVYNFYNRINLFLQRKYSEDAKCVITVNGKKDRIFYYYGTQNKQIWQLSITMERIRRDNENMYSPGGEYKGNFTLNLTHDMTNFNNAVWDLGLIGMPKGYFSEMQKHPDWYECSTWGRTSIQRVISSNEAKIYINDDCSSLISGRKNGFYHLEATMDFGGYKDSAVSYSSKSMKIHVRDEYAKTGEKYGAAAAGNIELHLEGNNKGTFNIISDSIYAEVATVGWDTRLLYENMDLGEIHDNNIWKSLEDKKARIRIKVKADKEAFK